MFRNRMMQFMVGRNGVDQLGRATILGALIFMIITMFSHSAVIYLISVALLIYSYFRMMSKNVSKRYLENQKYLQITDRIRPSINKVENGYRSFVQNAKVRRQQRSIYRFYKCPSCKQKLRVPKGHGKIEVTCRSCGTKFIRRS